MAGTAVVFSFKFAVATLAFVFPHTCITATTTFLFRFRSYSAFSITPKSVACDLLSVLGSPSDAARVDPWISKEIQSCLRFLVPFSPNPSSSTSPQSRMIELAGDGDAKVWWPPHSVMEMARIAVDSGGDPSSLQRLLDPTMLQVSQKYR